MTGNLVRALLTIVTAITLALASTQPVRGELPPLPIRLRTFAVNMSNNLTGANAILEITIDRWSSNEQRARLLDTVPKGQDALVDALQKAPINGRIRIPGWTGPDPNNYRLGWDLHYTHHEALPDGGDKIVFATDRLMSFWEIRNQPRTVDYPFTLAQILMPKEGKGQGKLAAFTKITFDKKKNAMEIENYGTEPVRLNEITVEKK
jgi:hypothetical protein